MTNKEIRKRSNEQLNGYRKKFAIFMLIIISTIIATKYFTYNIQVSGIIIYTVLSIIGVLSKRLYLNFSRNHEFKLDKGFQSFKVYFRYFIVINVYSIIVLIISTFIIILVSATGVVSFFDIFYNVRNKESIAILVGIFIIILSISILLTRIILQLFFFATPYLIIAGYNLGDSFYGSLDLMEGNKLRLLKLEMSFIGWILLCILTLGIAILWVGPYIAITKAKFYLIILEEKNIIITLKGA